MSNLLQCVSPVNGEVYVERSFATASEMDKTLGDSRCAQREWRNACIEARQRICSV